jgi:hypothetical protein
MFLKVYYFLVPWVQPVREQSVGQKSYEGIGWATRKPKKEPFLTKKLFAFCEHNFSVLFGLNLIVIYTITSCVIVGITKREKWRFGKYCVSDFF